MGRPFRSIALLLTSVSLLWSAGCTSRPTYPKEHVLESLQQLLTSEHLHPTLRFIDHTLAVQVAYPGALTQSDHQVSIGPSFDDVSRKVLTALHRVLLSSDAEVRFYVLLLSDPAIPGAYVTLVRYMDDVRRANANMLDTPEMFARTIFELNTVGPPTPLTIDQYVPRDIRLEEFLSWQLARRIQHTLVEGLEGSGIAHVGRCGGEFHNGEFAFTLNVVPAIDSSLDEATMRKIYATSTDVIARVLTSYHFNSFNSVRLIHPLTGRQLVLPKARLEVFR